MKLDIVLPECWNREQIIAVIQLLEEIVTALYRRYSHLLEPDTGFADEWPPDWL